MLAKFFQRCWGFVIPLLALPPIGIALYLAGVNPDLVQIFVMLSTFLVMMGALAYIVFSDSKKRWPGVSAFERFARVITFYRGTHG